MEYRCKDCSYQGIKRSPEGRCPACGSYNVETGSGASARDRPRSPLWHRVALVVSWGLLLVLIALRLLS